MPKLFVVSDIHSFYTPLKKALDEAGFDPNNEDHWLISCGDAFDRGDESYEVLKYLMSLERKILVKGNHDILLKNLCMRGFPYSNDYPNGTAKTVFDLGESIDGTPFDVCCDVTWKKTAAYRDLLVNYFETEKYIFVHSWVPLNVSYTEIATKPWHQKGKIRTYDENWRNATESQWEEAMWGNPFEHNLKGLNQTGKTIVFGHWHCSAGYHMDSDGEVSEFGEDACWEPYRDDNIIGIDRCTAHTGKVNVLVLEDDFLESN